MWYRQSLTGPTCFLSSLPQVPGLSLQWGRAVLPGPPLAPRVSPETLLSLSPGSCTYLRWVYATAVIYLNVSHILLVTFIYHIMIHSSRFSPPDPISVLWWEVQSGPKPRQQSLSVPAQPQWRVSTFISQLWPTWSCFYCRLFWREPRGRNSGAEQLNTFIQTAGQHCDYIHLPLKHCLRHAVLIETNLCSWVLAKLNMKLSANRNRHALSSARLDNVNKHKTTNDVVSKCSKLPGMIWFIHWNM